MSHIKRRPRGISSWPLEKRFWRNVEKSDGCWIWTACKWPNGYGLTTVNGRAVGAHRVAYTLTYGEITDGLWVLHRCDVRACVRPDHLFLGTNADNVRDMWSKGRGRGLNPHNGKLTDEERRKAVELVRCGVTKTEVGRRFGVTRQAINHLTKSDRYA